MSVIKCKMCGGNLELDENTFIGTCQYCGRRQPVSRTDDEKIMRLYDRADHFRRINEFDKAAGIYESILEEKNDDPEVYWGLLLCKYGIQYVEDSKTRRRIPTCNRTQLTPVTADEDYKLALRYANSYSRPVYEEQAKELEQIQRDIIQISTKAASYDVFICYKELDDRGQRTPDSVLAQEIYKELTDEGMNVFFARISLESKLGNSYEPYIYAALSSAKVMITVSTCREYINAPWVKNEWSRYLTLMRDGEKKTLIPAFRDMDPYDLPEEFALLQAQDLRKIGAVQDLAYGVKKLINVQGSEKDSVSQTEAKGTVSASESGATVESLLQRTLLFLEDGNFSQAQVYCNRVLDMAPMDYRPYWYGVWIAHEAKNVEMLKTAQTVISKNENYEKALRFAPEDVKKVIRECAKITEKNEQQLLQKLRKQYETLERKLKELSETRQKFEGKERDLFKNLDLLRKSGEEKNKLIESAEKKQDVYKAPAVAAIIVTFIVSSLFFSVGGWGDFLEGDRSAQIAICIILMGILIIGFCGKQWYSNWRKVLLYQKQVNKISSQKYIEQVDMREVEKICSDLDKQILPLKQEIRKKENAIRVVTRKTLPVSVTEQGIEGLVVDNMN